MKGISLGRYLLKKWLGGGRFGDVYLAEDTLLKKDFALKVIRVKPDSLEDLLEEARVLADLNHPNIVRFHTVDLIDDRLIIVMEYVDGDSLRKVISREAPLSQDRAIFYMTQILEALHFAHSKGIIHRDVKPENIIVTNKGHIKILDFGLAKLFEKDLSMSMGGTPLYMAPEAWKGEFSHLSDQWSCGAILYEMLTGRHPFNSSSVSELIGKINKEFSVPDVANIDEKLKYSIERALSPDPLARFESCLEFAKSINLNRPTAVILESPLNIRKEKIDILNMLSDEQRLAVEARGNILLLGGPGTGKTFALVAKAIYLVKKEKTPPSRILITTFSIRGYKEIERRLERYLGSDVEQMWIGNLHQLSIRILSRYGGLIGLKEDFSVAPPSQRRHIAQRIARKITKDIPAPDATIADIMRRFHYVRANLMGKDEFIKEATGRWKDLLEEFWDVYNKAVIGEGLLDYDDLIYYCAVIFKKYPHVVDFYRKRIDYLLIDESQDLNPAQIFIIESLGAGKTLFITGDDDQSIYQWRGGRPDYLLKLKNDPSFKVYKLTKSFRLPKEIRDAAFNLIQFNRRRIPKLFWTVKEGESFYIDVRALNTPQDEADFVCDIIDILKLKEHYSYSDFCILYRTNTRGRIFEQALRKRKIPYSFQFGKSLYKREEVQFALDLLKYASKPGPVLLKRLKNRAHIIGVSPAEAEESDTFKGMIEHVRDLKTPSAVLSVLLDLLGKQLLEKDREEGILLLNSVEDLFKQAKDFEERSRTKTISAFLNYIKFLVDSGLAEEDEGVRLLSVHSAKGLEFPVVFLVGMVEGEFPLSKAMGVEEEMEEERRLCYTAITRATEKLFITYYRFSSRYSRFEERPSRFIKEMLGI